MKKLVCILFFSFAVTAAVSQTYEFKPMIALETTPVISQGRTGTCWSFSTSSFLESEIVRLTGKHIDLSEMYTVRNTYPSKAWNYIMRQGKTQFSEGGLAHDVINSVAQYGLVPNEVYSGLKAGESRHDHSELVDSLKVVLKKYIKTPSDNSRNWKQDVSQILDAYLGENVESFTYEGVSYTPLSFLEMTTINPDDYLTFTSFTHQPYYSSFILNIPDNFSNGVFYNIPLNELKDLVDRALQNGYTVELDCDVSEPTFSSKYGVAVIPENKEHNKMAMTSLVAEKTVTPEFRQHEFENYNTTDDHLMHITGMVQDQKGHVYYVVKNSWGTDPRRVSRGGYIYMSEAYFKLKTISVMVHKDAVPEKLRKTLSL